MADTRINISLQTTGQAKLEKLNEKIRQLEGLLEQTGAELPETSRKVRGVGNSANAAASGFRTLGTAIKAALGPLLAIDVGRRYFQGFNEAEKAAAAVKTLGVNVQALEAQLLNVSNRLGGLYSQTQLLAASYDVASAGFADAADNAKILEAAAKGAVGGMSDLNTVGNATTSVLNAYGLSADKAAKLVDGFIQTQNDGKIVVDQYAQYIGKLAPLGKAAGVGIEELNAAISTITAQGVPVEATFTGLTQAMVAILKPTKEASDLAKGLGIDFSAAGLEAKGFGGLMAEVKQKTGGSTEAMTKLFGSVEALKAVLPLTNDDLVTFNNNLEKQGKAAGVADSATKELGGTVSSEITKMVNQIGNLVRALDTVLGPAIGGIIKLINAVIAEATKGINVLAQLFSMSKNTTILKQALESGDLRGNAAARVVPGIDELIGGERRQALQRQAGAGTGFLGLGFDAKKFVELLKQEPAIQKLLGAGGAKAEPGIEVKIDPKLQALLDSLLKDTGGGGGKGAKAPKDKKQLDNGADLLRQLQQSTALTETKSELDKEILGISQKYQNTLLDISKLEDQSLSKQLGEAALRQRNAEINDAVTKREAERLKEVTKREAERLETLNEQLTGFDRQVELAGLGTDKARQLKQIEYDILDLKKRGLLTSEEEIENYRRKATAAANVKKELTDTEKLWQDISQTVVSDLSQGIQGLIQGTTTLNDIASQLLSKLGGMFLDAAFSGLGKSLKLPGFADGGVPPVGQPSIVGEQGPEVFVPSQQGLVVPNDIFAATRAALAGGGSSQAAFDENADAIAVSNSYTRERMLERERQTMLTGAGGSTTVQTQVINNVEYATIDQVQEVANLSAKKARAQVFSDMRNRPSTRASLGMA